MIIVDAFEFNDKKSKISSSLYDTQFYRIVQKLRDR